MAVLLQRIHAEIGARLEASRAAVDEYERLEAALAALGGPIRARRLSPPEPAPEPPPAEPVAEAPTDDVAPPEPESPLEDPAPAEAAAA